MYTPGFRFYRGKLCHDITVLIAPGFPFERVHTWCTLQGFDSIEASYVVILPCSLPQGFDSIEANSVMILLCSFSQGFDSIGFILGVHSRVSIL